MVESGLCSDGAANFDTKVENGVQLMLKEENEEATSTKKYSRSFALSSSLL